jgi:hypothetical protein
MKSLLLALPLMFATAVGARSARAEVVGDRYDDSARIALYEDSARVQYHAQLMTIADRDILTARIEEHTARTQWDAAVRAGHVNAAGYWAQRHFRAMQDERIAMDTRAREASERDVAQVAFEWDKARTKAEYRAELARQTHPARRNRG